MALLSLACLSLGLGVDPAWAGSATLALTEREGAHGVSILYRSAPGERNDVGIGPDWSEDGSSFLWFPTDSAPGPPTAIVVSDGARLDPGAGCQRAAGANSDWLWCQIPAGARTLGPHVYLGDRNDTAEIDEGGSRWRDSVVFGGLGHDEIAANGLLVGGPGGDTIRGGGRVFGGDGRDLIETNGGNDEIALGAISVSIG